MCLDPSELRVRLVPLNMFKPPSDFSWPFQVFVIYEGYSNINATATTKCYTLYVQVMKLVAFIF